jgi:hypothetical protein
VLSSSVSFSADLPRLDGRISHDEAVFGEQIVTVLKQADLGLSVATLTCRVGISEQTF